MYAGTVLQASQLCTHKKLPPLAVSYLIPPLDCYTNLPTLNIACHY